MEEHSRHRRRWAKLVVRDYRAAGLSDAEIRARLETEGYRPRAVAAALDSTTASVPPESVERPPPPGCGDLRVFPANTLQQPPPGRVDIGYDGSEHVNAESSSCTAPTTEACADRTGVDEGAERSCETAEPLAAEGSARAQPSACDFGASGDTAAADPLRPLVLERSCLDDNFCVKRRARGSRDGDLAERPSHSVAAPRSDDLRNRPLADVPRDGESILVLRQEDAELIFAGRKTLEVCDRRFVDKQYWLGSEGVVLGRAHMRLEEKVNTRERWIQLFPEHCWDRADPPYRMTCMFRLTEISRLADPVPYHHKYGAFRICRFSPQRPE